MNTPMQPPAPPTQGWMPPPPQKKQSFFSRRWVQMVGAGLLGLVVGVAAGGGGTAATDEVGDAEITAAIARAEAAEEKLAEAQEQLAVQSDAAPAAPAEPPAPAEPAPAAPASGELQDGSFTSEQPRLKDDGLGDFGGTARVTNTSDSEKSGIFTYTLFKGGDMVGTAQGSASEVGAGETATVQLVSTDEFVAGVDRVEFQVDGEY
jgi:type II secretory pathway pseudopilin PulG